MQKVRTATYIIAMVCLGMIIGGAIEKVTAIWVVGLVLLILDIIIGIAIQYKMDNESKSEEANTAEDKIIHDVVNEWLQKTLQDSIDYMKRVNSIMNDESAKELFARKEILYAFISLADAKKKLPKRDFIRVEYAFDKLNQIFTENNDEILMDQKCFIRETENLIAHFDLIAPYYLFCGNTESMTLSKYFDGLKKDYRLKAKEIWDYRGFLTPMWNELHDAFMKEYYK